MNNPDPTGPNASARKPSPLGQVKVWHLSLLVLFSAVAIANIQDQRRSEPTLIALAAAGFVVYGLIGWACWRFARRFEARIGRVAILAIYLVGLASLFLGATVAYLLIERAYLGY